MKKTVCWAFRIVPGLTVLTPGHATIKQWNYNAKLERQYPPDGQFSDIGHNP